MSNTVPNPTRLKQIAHDSDTAKIIMENLESRTRQRTFSDIHRQKLELTRAGKKIVDADANRFWMLLQKEGYGSIVFDQKSRPEMFNWNYSLKEIAAIALDTDPRSMIGSKLDSAKPKHTLKPVPTPGETSSRDKTMAKITARAAKIERLPDLLEEIAPAKQKSKAFLSAERVVLIPLRDDYDAVVKLPGDVSSEEMEKFISRLRRAVSV
jgi:hypothetical protein